MDFRKNTSQFDPVVRSVKALHRHHLLLIFAVDTTLPTSLTFDISKLEDKY